MVVVGLIDQTIQRAMELAETYDFILCMRWLASR